MPSGYWQDLTTRDIEAIDATRTVALLPVAAIEQHGPHLPVGTDALINSGIVRATLPRLPAGAGLLVLPPIDYGASTEHEDFAGTVAVPPETLLSLWCDIGQNVARAGIRKLIILNSHGGQKSVVDLAAVRLRARHELFVVRCNYFSFGAPEGMFSSDEWAFGLHGGEIETSLMLHLHPELVRTDRLENFASTAERMARENRWLGAEKPVGFGWKAQDLNPAGVVGNAAAADAERGADYLGHIAGSLAELVSEVVVQKGS